MWALTIFHLLLVSKWIAAEYSTLDISISKYKALTYQETENLEHLYYSFDFCLCTSNYTGYLPNTSPLCQCVYQQKGKKVIESIPQAYFSASCVHSYTSAKCLNAKFNGTALGTKIYAKVMVGRTILTYPSWQPLVYSRYKTTSTLKTVAGDNMRITYISILRRIIGDYPDWNKSAATTTAAPWKKIQPTDSSQDVAPLEPAFHSEIFDILRQDFNKAKSWTKQKLEKWFPSTEEDSKQMIYTKFPTKTTMWTRWTTAQTTVPLKTTELTTTTRPTTTTQPATQRTTTRSLLPKSQIKSWRNNVLTDLSDVAFIRNVGHVMNFLLKRSLIDRVNPVGYDVQTVKENLVFYHNLYREQHDAPEVRENYYLNSLAQHYADHLARTKSCLVHEQPRVYGENLFVYGAQHYPDPATFAKAVTQSFYMEGYSYNYNSWYPQSYYKTGHFTQLVWRESRQIGIGISIAKTDGHNRGACFPRSPAYMIYICVKYDPAGNFESSEAYKRNVLPLRRL